MSFLYKNNKTKNTTKKRKENDSFCTHHFDNKFHLAYERTSAFVLRGTITLEASIAAVIFFFGILCLIGCFEIMEIQIKMKSALHAVAKEVAVQVCTNPQIPISEMEQRIVEIIGKEELERSLIVGGQQGIDCSNSKKYWDTTIMELSVKYRVEIPVLMFGIPVMSKEEVVRVKGWTGYEEKTEGTEETIMVYVTDYGGVYHKDRECAYLDLSVKMSTKEQIKEIRSQNGTKYKKCSYCEKTEKDVQSVYITDYGEKYHFTLDCKGLKRTVYSTPLSSVEGMGGCSKCVE